MRKWAGKWRHHLITVTENNSKRLFSFTFEASFTLFFDMYGSVAGSDRKVKN
jgi:hypothetical protein